MWWFIVTRDGGAHASQVTRFLSPFPLALQSAALLAWMSVLLCVVALVLATVSIRRAGGRNRAFDTVIAFVAVLLLTWNVFGML